MKIEQLLHGYDNGHRLLAGSVLLKNSTDMDNVATLSDWSEYVAPGGGESSYVTAYPLQESGYYVIAKTWYADEMKRPGCVWTHSLLVPLEALNGLDDFRRIGKLFKRPSIDDGYDEYSHTINYDNRHYSADDYVPLGIERRLESQILVSFLYLEAVPVIFNAHKDNKILEDAMYAIMNTLPQTIIQKLSWCSGTAYLRKFGDTPLTCQFVSRLAGGNGANKMVEEEKWFTFVLDAIMRGDVNQGQLIRMFAEDIGDNPQNFTAIAKTLYKLEDYFDEGMTSEQRYRAAFSTIVDSFPDKLRGRVIKKLFTNKTFSDRYCNSFSFFLFIATLPVDEAIDYEETGLEDRWSRFLIQERDRYLSLLGEIFKSSRANKWGIGKLKESACVLKTEEITELIKDDYRLFSTITLLNSELLNKIPWSLLSQREIESILPLVLDERSRNTFRGWEDLLAILLEKGIEISGDLAKEAFTKTNKATKILLDYVNKDTARYVNHVFAMQISNKTNDVLAWLSSVDVITEHIAYAIVNAVNERSNVVITKGAKIWRPFIGLRFQNLNAKVYSYLFALSFNWLSDHDALALMQMAFQPLHTLQAQKKLSYDNWMQVAPYMESVMIWEEWDYCKKMRKTVVKRLKKAGMDKHVLDNYTTDAALNAELKRMW